MEQLIEHRRYVYRKTLKQVLFYICLNIIIFVWLVPLLISVFTALKTNADLYSGGGLFGLPRKIMWSNFVNAWIVGGMSTYFKNSVLVVLIKVPLHVIVCTLAAFALTKMGFKYANTFLIIILVGQMLPIHVALIPLTLILNATKFLDTYQGLILAYLGFTIPFGTFLARSYFKTIPRELDEAALIDGCGNIKRYLKIIMPLATPIIAVMIILDFLGTWNELLMALLFMRTQERRTVPIGLLSYRDRFYADYTLMNAGILISTVPVSIVYIVFQKYFISGIIAGSLKG
jgi:raffinose/stachyose/melibiose transport system permease protein